LSNTNAIGANKDETVKKTAHANANFEERTTNPKTIDTKTIEGTATSTKEGPKPKSEKRIFELRMNVATAQT
jgi:hypothetical protein